MRASIEGTKLVAARTKERLRIAGQCLDDMCKNPLWFHRLNGAGQLVFLLFTMLYTSERILSFTGGVLFFLGVIKLFWLEEYPRLFGRAHSFLVPVVLAAAVLHVHLKDGDRVRDTLTYDETWMDEAGCDAFKDGEMGEVLRQALLGVARNRYGDKAGVEMECGPQEPGDVPSGEHNRG